MKYAISLLALALLCAPLAHAGKKNGEKGGKKQRHGHLAKLDTNQDKQLSLEEFKASKKAQKHPEKAEAKFKKIDTNSDGQITKEEFKAAKAAHKAKKAGKGEKKAKKVKGGKKKNQ